MDKIGIIIGIIFDGVWNIAKEAGFFIWLIIAWKYFFHSLLILLFVLFLRWFFKEYKKWNRGWLSQLIDQKISESKSKNRYSFVKKIYGLIIIYKNIFRVVELVKLNLLEATYGTIRYIKDKVSSDIKNLFLPSPTSLVILLISFIIFFVFSHINVPYHSIFVFEKWTSLYEKSIGDNKLSNIISVISGLVAVVFALVIFIAESIRDGKNPEQKRIILRVSRLWFLITFTTIGLLNFLWFKINILGLIFPVIIAGTIVYSFWKIIFTLVDPEVYKENQIKLLKERIKKIIFDSIRERIGNNILLNKVGSDKEIKIEYTFSKNWLDQDASSYLFIESVKDGWLSDINLEELSRLAEKLEITAQQLGFSIYSNTSSTLNGGEDSRSTGQSEHQKVLIKKVYLLKRYGEHLPPNSIFTEGSKVIIALPKEFAKNKDLVEYIKNLIPHIFRFKKTEPSSVVFQRELQGTKDQLVNSIRAISLGSVDELKQTYLHLAETFLETLHEFGGGFSSEQAAKERGNIFEGWNEIRWLNRDIRELIIVAVATDNQDVISDIVFLPIAIAIRAIQARDHLLFQEFINFSSFIYYLSCNKPDGEIKSFMIERSWRHLKELAEIYIEPQLKDRKGDKDSDNIKEYEDFAIYIFKVFQNILKDSYEKRDINTFKKILYEFLRLYRHFDPENEHPDSEFLEQSLQWTNSEDEKNGIRKKIIFQKEKEGIARRIRLSRSQVLFGLAGKILEKYFKNQNDVMLKDFFDEISKHLPDDIKELTKIFDSARSFETEDFWGWDNWEMIPDGEVHSIDVHGNLDRLYCVKSLHILGEKDDETIAKTDLPYSRNFAYLADDNSTTGVLNIILNLIVSDSKQWEFVLSSVQIAKVSIFKTLLKKAKDSQKKSEEKYLETAIIDDDKLKEFKKELHQEFKKAGILRPIVNKLKVYKDLTGQTLKNKILSWGYNQIDSKAIFIKNWHVHYSNWGEQYGRGMANSEDQIVFEEMIKGIKSVKNVIKQNIIQEIEKIVASKKFKNPIIFQTLEYNFEYEQIKKSELFISSYRNDCPKTEFDGFNGYMGVIKLKEKNIPVIDLFINKNELKNKVVITDLGKLGIWNQYSPADNQEDSIYKEGIFSLRIIDLNKENEAKNKIISENPTWLQKYENKDEYLRRHIVIKLYQKFKFEIKNPSAGYRLNVTDEIEIKENILKLIQSLNKIIGIKNSTKK